MRPACEGNPLASPAGVLQMQKDMSMQVHQDQEHFDQVTPTSLTPGRGLRALSLVDHDECG